MTLAERASVVIRRLRSDATTASGHLPKLALLFLSIVIGGLSLTSAGCRSSQNNDDSMSNYSVEDVRVCVDVGLQRLTVLRRGRKVATYPVSTATLGTGSESGSNRTPLGLHRVCKKIGDGEPHGMIFVGRVPVGKIATIKVDAVDAAEDLILTRILWLDGLEEGKNRGGSVDSRSRYIYIHGTNEEGLIGRPASHGCVRMRNADVVELCDLIVEGVVVEIVEGNGTVGGG